MVRRLCALVLLCAGTAWAAGPRWVAGGQWTNASQAMTWYRNDVQYFVDAGPLSDAVDHAAAVALVADAAAPWNVPGLKLTFKDGGSLAEDVSSANVYPGTNGLIWPSDTTAANYTAKQVAVVLDADGAITDLLLGASSSAPANCRTNGVTEFTDLFIQPGRIAHSVMVVNGRCSGPAPEQQLQLRYQMQRAFGRALGLGWSQTNDNVFTGTPAPTYEQQMHWPIMHPMDILCGPYTYACLPLPFTLRDDDIGSLRTLYGDVAGSQSMTFQGNLYFIGSRRMNGANVTATRSYPYANGDEGYETTSAVSGMYSPSDRATPVNGASVDTLGVAGFNDNYAAFFRMNVPVVTTQNTHLHVKTQPVNPLYVGPYRVGPARLGSPAPSGSALDMLSPSQGAGRLYNIDINVDGAVTECNSGADGTEAQPALLPADGAWSARLCSIGHVSWFTLPVLAGRTATLEVTATDEKGVATMTKAMPILGVWHRADNTTVLPTLDRAPSAFNSRSSGTTQLTFATTLTERVRIAVVDARGDGRPDFTYRGRVLYAESVLPARLGSAGGSVRILGTGFLPGNTVTIGGVAATVTGLSATEINAVAPTAKQLRSAGANDVTVFDPRTGGTTTIAGGLVYAGVAADALSVVTAPPAEVPVAARAVFAVKLTAADGKPLANSEVAVSVTGGSAAFGACALSQCTLLTGGDGMAATTVSPQAAGNVVVQARSAGGSTVRATFTATVPARSITALRPVQYIAARAGAAFSPGAVVTANGVAVAGQAVTFSAASASVVLPASAVSNADDTAAVTAAGSLRAGESVAVRMCAWTDVCTSETLTGVAESELQVIALSGAAQSVSSAGDLGDVVLRVVDGAGHPVAGATVMAFQTVLGWQPPCPATGRCATAPVYGRSTTTLVSDDDGLVTLKPLQYPGTAGVTQIWLLLVVGFL